MRMLINTKSAPVIVMIPLRMTDGMNHTPPTKPPNLPIATPVTTSAAPIQTCLFINSAYRRAVPLPSEIANMLGADAIWARQSRRRRRAREFRTSSSVR